MTHPEEVASGIELLKSGAQSCRCTLTFQQLSSREIYYFRLQKSINVVDFTLSEAFLSDRPNTPSHKHHLTEARFGFSDRLTHGSASNFYAISGTPFNLSILCPLNRPPSRDVVCLHAGVEDLRYPDFVARVAAVLFGSVEKFEFKFKCGFSCATGFGNSSTINHLRTLSREHLGWRPESERQAKLARPLAFFACFRHYLTFSLPRCLAALPQRRGISHIQSLSVQGPHVYLMYG
jgi:hypothetical protein